MPAPAMGIVLVNYGSHALLETNVPAPGPDFVVVVVDNWHSDEERGAVRGLSARRGWVLVEQDDNVGFGAATNAGLARAAEEGCDTFLVLNPDAQLTVAVLRGLREHVRERTRELVAPVIEDVTGRRVFVGVELLLDTGRMRRAGTGAATAAAQLWLTGACLAFHADVLAATGGFATDYFLYWEDVDLSVRAVRAGCTLAVREDLVVRHDEGGTQQRRPDDRAKSKLYYYYNARNRLLFAARLLPWRRRLRWLVATPAASREILLRGGRRQLLHSRAPLWAVLAGTRDGVRAVLRRQPTPDDAQPSRVREARRARS